MKIPVRLFLLRKLEKRKRHVSLPSGQENRGPLVVNVGAAVTLV